MLPRHSVLGLEVAGEVVSLLELRLAVLALEWSLVLVHGLHMASADWKTCQREHKNAYASSRGAAREGMQTHVRVSLKGNASEHWLHDHGFSPRLRGRRGSGQLAACARGSKGGIRCTHWTDRMWRLWGR